MNNLIAQFLIGRIFGSANLFALLASIAWSIFFSTGLTPAFIAGMIVGALIIIGGDILLRK